MMVKLGFERARVQANGVDCGLARQRRIGAITYPAGETGLGGADATVEFARPVLKRDQSAVRRENVRLVAAAAAVGAFRGHDFELDLLGLLGNHRRRGFGVVTVQPGKSCVALDHGDGRGFFGKRLFGFALEPLGTQMALLPARDFLHDTNAAHRHEVARHA